MSGELVTVFGGSGFIGTYVVRALCKRGYRVRVAVRSPHTAPELRVMGAVGQVQLVQANVRAPESVARALEGADAAINLVGVLYEGGRQRFMSVHSQGAKNVAEACREAGIERFIHLSAIGADANSDSLYARSKAQGEAFVTAAVPTATLLRPSVVFGIEDQFFNKFADIMRFAPAIVPLPLLMGGGKSKFQPVYVGDIAEAAMRTLERPDARGRTFELGGPQIMSLREVLRFILKVTDRKRILMPTPWFAAYLLGMMGECVGLAPFFEPFLTRDQVRQLRRDNVVGAGGDDVGTFDDLGVSPETVDAVVPAYLERFRKYGQFHEKAA